MGVITTFQVHQVYITFVMLRMYTTLSHILFYRHIVYFNSLSSVVNGSWITILLLVKGILLKTERVSKQEQIR